MIRVYTCGVFDLFHAGHLQFLQKAKALGDYLIVGVLPDQLAESFKRRPITPFKQRIEIVRNIRCVDEAIESRLTKDLKAEFYQERKIDIHCNGDDVLVQQAGKYKRDYNQSDYAVPIRLGIIRFIPYSTIISTSEIIARIKRGS